MKRRIAFIVMLFTMASSQIAFADSGVVNTASLYVRQKPSLLASISGSISKNTKINTLGKEGNFYKISYKGKIGYVYSSYINIVKRIPAPIVKAKVTPVKAKVTPISIKATPIKVTPTYLEKYGEIIANNLNVRSGAGTTFPVTGNITLGSKVTILENINGFYKIIFCGKTSYISALYVKVTEKKTVTTISTSSAITLPVLKSTGVGTITASDFLNVRKTASLDNDVTILGLIYPDEKVDIYGTENEFYKIKYSGEWGYIYKSYVSVANAPLNKAQYVADGQQYDAYIDGDDLVSYSNTFLGMPYIWGGATPAKFDATGKYLSGGFDCSGFVQYNYKNFGVNLPRTTMDQVNIGESVNIDDLQNGDLVFFMTNVAAPSQVSHVGIYVGNNKFMHSPKPGDVIKISELTGYYKQNFVIGKRILN